LKDPKFRYIPLTSHVINPCEPHMSLACNVIYLNLGSFRFDPFFNLGRDFFLTVSSTSGQTESRAPITAETLTLTEGSAGKGRKRKKHEAGGGGGDVFVGGEGRLGAGGGEK
jgi:hypothetical protein